MSICTIRGHAVPTQAYQGHAVLGKLARSHVFVSSSSGRSWGCFGRSLKDLPGAPVVVEADGEDEWVNEIAGPRGDAFAVNKQTGVCHQCANRMLIPANVTVDAADGNEVAILMFGLYGPNIKEVVTLVSDAAQRANDQNDETVTLDMLDAAIAQVTRNGQDEYEILKNDFEERIPLDVDALPTQSQNQLRQIHRQLHESRIDAYLSYKSRALTQEAYLKRLQELLGKSLLELVDMFGQEQYLEVFKLFPEDAVEFIRRHGDA